MFLEKEKREMMTYIYKEYIYQIPKQFLNFLL